MVHDGEHRANHAAGGARSVHAAQRGLVSGDHGGGTGHDVAEAFLARLDGSAFLTDATLGDLAESMIKRDLDIKDMGNTLTLNIQAGPMDQPVTNCA